MPSKSKAQQRAAGLAYAAKKGKIPASQLRGAAKQMYKSMSKKELRKFAHTRHKGLPKHVKEMFTPFKIGNSLLVEGRDDIRKLKLGKEGVRYARMTGRDVMKQPGGVAEKVKKRYAMIKSVTRQKNIKSVFPSMDKGQKVKKAFKLSSYGESASWVLADKIVEKLLQ